MAELEQIIGDELSAVAVLVSSDKLSSFPHSRNQLVRLRTLVLCQPRVLGAPFADKNSRLAFSAAADRARSLSELIPVQPKVFRLACAKPKRHRLLAGEAASRINSAYTAALNEEFAFASLHKTLLNAGDIISTTPANDLGPAELLCVNYVQLVRVHLIPNADHTAMDLPQVSDNLYCEYCRRVLLLNGYRIPTIGGFRRGLLVWLLLVNAAGLLITPDTLSVQQLQEWRLTARPPLHFPAIPWFTEPADLPALIMGFSMCLVTERGLPDSRGPKVPLQEQGGSRKRKLGAEVRKAQKLERQKLARTGDEATQVTKEK